MIKTKYLTMLLITTLMAACGGISASDESIEEEGLTIEHPNEGTVYEQCGFPPGPLVGEFYELHRHYASWNKTGTIEFYTHTVPGCSVAFEPACYTDYDVYGEPYLYLRTDEREADPRNYIRADGRKRYYVTSDSAAAAGGAMNSKKWNATSLYIEHRNCN